MPQRTTAFMFLLLFASAPKASLIFDFTFVNAANGGGTVTGLVRGLVDNANGQAAASVEVTSNSDGFGLGEYVGNPLSPNSWDVQAGEITMVDFLSYGAVNSPPAVTCCSLQFDNLSLSTSTLAAGLSPLSDLVPVATQGDPTQVFVRRTAIPLPPTIALFSLGLLAVRLASRRAVGWVVG